MTGKPCAEMGVSGKEQHMKAWVLHGVGDIRPEEVPVPQAAEREVLVAVKAAGICGSDIPRIYGTGAHVHPLVPGHEFSGVVEAVGAGADSKWTGKRVGIFPLIPCGKCAPCRRRRYELCRQYGYLGSRRDGGFAEYVRVPEWNLVELPDRVSFAEAAMLEPMAVAVHAMRRLMPDKDAAVVVYGLGTIGLLLVLFLMDAGIRRILAVGNKDFQKQMFLQTGLDGRFYYDGRDSDVDGWVREHTDGAGADAVFECVGRNETFARAVGLVAPEGKVCLVGNPLTDMTLGRDIYWKILRNQLFITGTWNSSYLHDSGDDWHYVLDRLSAGSVPDGEGMVKRPGRIAPEMLVTHRLPLDELDYGLHVMRDKTEDYVKIMAVGR